LVFPDWMTVTWANGNIATRFTKATLHKGLFCGANGRKPSPSFTCCGVKRSLFPAMPQEIVKMTGPIDTVVDLGPGEVQAVQTNTIPFIRAADEWIKNYVSVDLCESYANDAADIVSAHNPKVKTFPLNQDFLLAKPYYPASPKVLGLCFGGIVGKLCRAAMC
jgi:uncharacterized SAM-dependent methyltransferase